MPKSVGMVEAAGNGNSNACNYSPALTTSAITVGSTAIDDTRSSFGNWVPCVDVYATGSDVASAGNSSPMATNTFSGTCMATPRKFVLLLMQGDVFFSIRLINRPPILICDVFISLNVVGIAAAIRSAYPLW